MMFNSIAFAVFLPVVFIIYWYLAPRRRSAQNMVLLLASYLFYGWWDWRFLFLIFISSLCDYTVGIWLYTAETLRVRRSLLAVSLLVNLGLLGFFKYFNFFITSFVGLMNDCGLDCSFRSLNIILPIGISFYTFQTLSYTIDVYRRKLRPTRDPIAFFTFVAFFPQLVAGPIERAKNLLGQFETEREFDYSRSVDGLRRILWGLFKKIVIADMCATHVDMIFAQSASLSGSVLLLGVVYFAFQIYSDFSGYSDIAIGCAQLFGVQLSHNFAYPYFSRSMPEFWRRWHISLSTWFRDYVYIPLGGSRCSKIRWSFNVIVTFVVSGLWHGASWTFVLWGFFHAICYMPSVWLGTGRKTRGAKRLTGNWNIILNVLSWVVTFGLVLLGWVLFRAETIQDAIVYYNRLLSASLFSLPSSHRFPALIILFLWVMEWAQRNKGHVLDIGFFPAVIRWAIYYVLIFAIFWFYKDNRAFIYFQF